MSAIDKLDRALTLVVPRVATKDHNQADLIKLMESYKIIEIAKNDLLAQRITWEEYIELCQLHGVNVDAYMQTIEHNFIELKLH